MWQAAPQRGGADADDDDLVIDLNESSDDGDGDDDDLTLTSDDEPSPPAKKTAGKSAPKRRARTLSATDCADRWVWSGLMVPTQHFRYAILQPQTMMLFLGCAARRPAAVAKQEAKPTVKPEQPVKAGQANVKVSPAAGKMRAVPKSLASTPAAAAEAPPSATNSQLKPRATPATKVRAPACLHPDACRLQGKH